MIKVKYFGRKVRGIAVKTINADINRGVTTFNEKSYTVNHGSTSNSLAFFNAMMKHDIGNVKGVKFEQSEKHWYTTTLTTDKGYTIILKGLSFGYHGEGSRGAESILKALGFNKQQVAKVFTKQSNFRLRKAVAI